MTDETARPRQPWGLPLRARVIVALVAALIIGAKFYLRMPIHVPGHSGVFWMALLLIGVGVVGRPGTGTLIGLISGLLAVIILPGREGIFVGVKYFVPGLIVDVLTPLLGGRLDRYPAAVIVAAAAHMGKLTASYLLGLALGVPGGYLAIGLGFAAVTHLGFGALGGVAAAFVLQRLSRAGMLPDATPSTEVAS
ncbi:MAG: cobalt ABC transporter permease [Coriobacteriia bacterium]|nr:cobalt ABC transporter permease [Coriobacteriia bacterium]